MSRFRSANIFPYIKPPLLDEIASYKIAMGGLPAGRRSQIPSELSGGMVKRAGLARALALDPELLFLDEPTAGLDPIAAAAFDELIRSLQKRLDLTVFLITHDLDTLHAICDRIAVLADKKVLAVGTIPELLALDHPWIQEYFNGPRGRAAADSYENEVDGLMETRSNYIMVGAVTVALLAGVLLFIVWLAGLSNKQTKCYDIYFAQGVGGLNKGSNVSFSGVPVGQVEARFRCFPTGPNSSGCGSTSIEQTPVLQGTTAQIKGVGFTGVSEIQLDGAVARQPADHADRARRDARSFRQARAASARCSTARRN